MLNRADLVVLVRRIIELDGTEEEVDGLIRSFLAAAPHPDALNILGKHDDPEAIVDEVLSFGPTTIPSGESATG